MGVINAGFAGGLSAEMAVGEATPARFQFSPRADSDGGRFGSFPTIAVSAVASVSGTSVHA
jgi:hypothetical protein